MSIGSSAGDTRGGEPTTSYVDALDDRLRRATLGELTDRETPIPVRRLALAVAAHVRDRPPGRVPEKRREEIALSLHHQHLPVLDEVGLVEYDGGRAAIAAQTDVPVEELVDSVTELPDDAWELLADLLRDERRKTIVSVLADSAEETVEVDRLEAAVRERHSSDRESPEQVASEVRHVHLPVLAEDGVLSYDGETDEVTYCGHPTLRQSWLDPEVTLEDALLTDRSSTTVGSSESFRPRT